MSTSALELQNLYLDYLEDTECPTLFHRWSLIAGVSALLERNIWLPFGLENIYPNQFVVLLGPPASRKSTAINALGRVLSEIGYDKFSGDKSSKEKFIQDMSVGFNLLEEHKDKGKNIYGDTLSIDEILGESYEESKPDVSSVFIKVSEMQDFMGQNNHDFISWLTNMWDNPDDYHYRIRNGESDKINKPTISMLGGATQDTFATMFPLNILQQGMMSRMLLIYGEGRRKKIAFPTQPPKEKKDAINGALLRIKNTIQGEVRLNKNAKKMLDEIYQDWEELPDSRFATYGGRRFTHLLKMCMVNAAMRYSTTIVEDDVLVANTILSYTETLMPKALGEFGKNEDSNIAATILNKIKEREDGVTPTQLREALAGITLNGNKIHAVMDQLHALKKIDILRVQGETGEPEIKYVAMQAMRTNKVIHTDFTLLPEYLDAKQKEKENSDMLPQKIRT